MDFMRETAHRPYPMPDRPWVMRQTWSELLFAHWPIPADLMRQALPPALTPDLFEGQAWLGVVPFSMRRVYPRHTFPVPWLSDFLELNVRTYVTLDGRPGVFFFSLDAANPLAVTIARGWYRLPYFNAQMTAQTEAGWRRYHSVRTHAGAPAADFQARYRPAGPAYTAVPGALDHWLTERYCLYTVADGDVYRGEIHHGPWPLHSAEAEIAVNTMAAPAGLTLPPQAPLLHYVPSIEMVAWPIERVR